MSAVAERTALDAARRVVAAVGEEVEAAYLIGSAATGAFEPGLSDLDVVAVLRRRPSQSELHALIERARSVDVAPARGLELVVYSGGEIVVNLNTGPGLEERVSYEPEFWFVIDRAIAEQSAVTLSGPPWQAVFEPLTRQEVLDALGESLRWHEQNEPASRNTVLNAVRTWRYLETGRWTSKPEAARWLLDRVRQTVEGAP